VPGYCDSCSEVPGGAQLGSGVCGIPEELGAFTLGAAAMGDSLQLQSGRCLQDPLVEGPLHGILPVSYWGMAPWG